MTMDTQNALATTDIQLDFSAIERADLSPWTKYKYRRELAVIQLAGVSPMDYTALAAYADTLESSRKALLKSALRLVSLGFEQDMKAQATPGNVAAVQAGVFRLEAMRDTVKVQTHKGTYLAISKAGNRDYRVMW